MLHTPIAQVSLLPPDSVCVEFSLPYVTPHATPTIPDSAALNFREAAMQFSMSACAFFSCDNADLKAARASSWSCIRVRLIATCTCLLTASARFNTAPMAASISCAAVCCVCDCRLFCGSVCWVLFTVALHFCDCYQIMRHFAVNLRHKRKT